MTLKLLESHRQALRKPLGAVVDSTQAAAAARGKFVVAVGDVCTAALLEEGVLPNVAVVDFRTARGPIDKQVNEKIVAFKAKAFRAANPAGTISEEAARELKNAFECGGRKENAILFIDGEEDLLLLQAVMLAPKNALLFYGQPHQGAVLVKASEENKRKVRQIIEECFDKA